MSDQNNPYNQLDAASLKYLAGLRETIDECGMQYQPPAPKMPATFNMSANSAEDIACMLKALTNLDDTANDTHSMKDKAVQSVDPSPIDTHDSDSMSSIIKMIDDAEIIQDGMDTDVPVYDNSPDRETHGGNWPLDGDVDNNLAANKDVLVNRNKMDIAEQLMADYRNFMSEAEINDTVISDEESKLMRQIKSFEDKINQDPDHEMAQTWRNHLKSLEIRLNGIRAGLRESNSWPHRGGVSPERRIVLTKKEEPPRRGNPTPPHKKPSPPVKTKEEKVAESKKKI